MFILRIQLSLPFLIPSPTPQPWWVCNVGRVTVPNTLTPTLHQGHSSSRVHSIFNINQDCPTVYVTLSNSDDQQQRRTSNSNDGQGDIRPRTKLQVDTKTKDQRLPEQQPDTTIQCASAETTQRGSTQICNPLHCLHGQALKGRF